MYAYGKPALEDLLAGKADFATVAETPVMLEILNGKRISIIATIEMSKESAAVVARGDRGIREISDLKGRIIATTRGTAADYFLDALLAEHGIARNEIRVVDMKADLLTGALVRGDIDAASLFDPYATLAQNGLGGNRIIFHDEDIYTLTFNVVAAQDFIRQNPGKIKKLLRALIRAEQYVRTHKAESQKILADFTGMDIAFVRDLWVGSDFRVTLDQSLLLALEDESHWAIKNKLTPARAIPDYLDFIYFDGLQSVKPEALMILR
jgi:NitT/TauT family transport system substrate-binding protein